jgi:hypothetical protein
MGEKLASGSGTSSLSLLRPLKLQRTMRLPSSLHVSSLALLQHGSPQWCLCSSLRQHILSSEVSVPLSSTVANTSVVSWQPGRHLGHGIMIAPGPGESLSLLQGALALVAFPGFTLSTESPRWLVSLGRSEEAKPIAPSLHFGLPWYLWHSGAAMAS